VGIKARMRCQGRRGYSYSSRIQLPTDTPPQLIPVAMLPAVAVLSRLVWFLPEPVTEMGWAPLPY
jgi:hypothetical protein